MSLIKCPNCGRDISDTADKCIHCNYKINIENSNNENNNANANNALNLNNDNKKDNKYIKIKKSIFLTLIIIIVLLLVCLIATISFKNNDNLDIQEMDLVQIKPVQLKDDEIEYIYEVDMNSKLPSNLKPGVYIDLYFSGFDNDINRSLSGTLISNVKIVDVRDKNNNTIDTSISNEIPKIIKLAVTKDSYDLLSNFDRLKGKHEFQLLLINVRTNLENEIECKIASQYLKDYILSFSGDIPQDIILDIN